MDHVVHPPAADPPTPPRVLVAGGGIAALEATLAIRAHLGPTQARITLLAPNRDVRYPPLSVLQPFDRHAPWAMPLAAFAEDTDADVRHGVLAAVDVAGRIATTTEHEELVYDVLLVASGARPDRALEGAEAFRGAYDVDRLVDVLDELTDVEQDDGKAIRTVAFVAPGGASWSLPLYELALLTAARLRTGSKPARTILVTSEHEPLAVFGPIASDAVRARLERHDIELHTGAEAVRFTDGTLELADGRRLDVDRCIALPELHPRSIDGLPSAPDGFLPIDDHARVEGCPGVYAAGDVTQGAVKQGGLACQQADAAAEAIVADLGGPITPTPYQPVLRGILLSDEDPLALRATLTEAGQMLRPPERPVHRRTWPHGKIIGHYLDPYLVARGDGPVTPDGPTTPRPTVGDSEL
ncbi:MAG: NAD(P)/FAD-dependent oxidoreductase [Solirubrobacteraceae bacterium]